jgi:hypothetical protein
VGADQGKLIEGLFEIGADELMMVSGPEEPAIRITSGEEGWALNP